MEGKPAPKIELLDATSQKGLATYAEELVNYSKSLTKNKDSLEPVLEIFEYWARKFRQSLDEQPGLPEDRATRK